MIGRICLLLEALSIVICLHHLYGKKFKLDIATISLLAIDMIMMTTIDYFGWPSTLSIIIYPIIAIYCGIEFGFEWKKIVINNILYMIIVCGVQLVVTFVYYYIFSIEHISNLGLLGINIIILFMIWFVMPRCNIKRWFSYVRQKSKALAFSGLICILTAIFFLLGYKNNDGFELYQSTLLFLCIAIIAYLAVQLGKTQIKEKEIETELRMHKLYADSYKSLIENIRIRQHEFDNHINMIYSQHLLCSTFEELVEKQQKYCKEIEKDNRYNKLLKNDNQEIRGFLYTNFLRAEKFGVQVSYKIVIDKLDINMPVYKLIEILGNLIKNAVEAMLDGEVDKKLHVSIIEVENGIDIEVRNISKVIPHRDIPHFFTKGYSEKGQNRGLGLYNVKKICDEFEFSVMCDNKVIDGTNWLVFMVTNKNE